MIFRGYYLVGEGYDFLFQGRFVFVSAWSELEAYKVMRTFMHLLHDGEASISSIEYIKNEFELRGESNGERGPATWVVRRQSDSPEYLYESDILNLCNERDYARLRRIFYDARAELQMDDI